MVCGKGRGGSGSWRKREAPGLAYQPALKQREGPGLKQQSKNKTKSQAAGSIRKKIIWLEL